MPRLSRTTKSTPLLQSEAIEEVVRACARSIEETIRREVALRLDEAVARALAEQQKKAPRSAAAAAPRMCPVPGCGKPAAGPRNRWRCREHAKLPAGVTITRLPPGPAPREKAPRQGPSMDCRVPGCTVRSRGPRYDFFCSEHYKQFPADERRRITAEWKARKAQDAQQPRMAEPTVLLRRGAEVRAIEHDTPRETAESESS